MNEATAEKDAAKVAEIKRRQTLLFDAFSHNGVLGDRYLGNARCELLEKRGIAGDDAVTKARPRFTVLDEAVLVRGVAELHINLSLRTAEGLSFEIAAQAPQLPERQRS